MIPKKLTIEGLYSYREKQTIDFTNLTDSGLFGIFGATGSGKSSILEAISYALYGQTERMNAQDKRKYNMMNLRSDRACIEFYFYNYENELYQAKREIKRNSKQFTKIRTPEVTFYQQKEGEWVPLDHTDAEKIVGLSYDNFKRTIIIPQGQFKEFLELGAKARTDMMKEIFQLHRYDLQNKTSRLNKQNQSELDNLKGQLKSYESVSEEEINEKKSDLKGAKANRDEVQQKHQAMNEKFQRLKHLKDEFETLKEKQESFSKLGDQKPEIEKKQQRIDEYERIYKAFHQLLKDLEKNEGELRTKEEDKEKAETKLKKLADKHAKKEGRLKEIEPYFEKLNQKKKEADDLGFIIKILKASKMLKEFKASSTRGEKKVDEIREQESKIQSQIEETEKEIAELKDQKLDSKLLRAVEKWFAKAKHINDSYSAQNKKVDRKQAGINQLLHEAEEKQINLEMFDEEIGERLENLSSKESELKQKRDRLNIQQEFADHAHALHDGEPCPLCGSTDHPDIVETDDVTDELEKIAEELGEIETKKSQLQKKKSEATGLLDKKQLLEENLSSEKEELEELKDKIEEHQSGFVWDEFNPEKPEEFEEKQAQTNQTEEEIGDKDEKLEQLREDKDKNRGHFEECREALQKLRKKENTKQAQIDSNKGNLEVLKYENYQNEDSSEVSKQLDELKQKNDNVEQKHQSLSKAINDLKPEIASQQRYIDTLAGIIEELNGKISSIQQRVKDNLENEKIDKAETVQKILSQEIDVDKGRDEIQSFNEKYKILKSSIEELEKKLEADSFDEDQYQQTEENWKTSKQKLNDARDAVAKLDGKMDDLKAKLEQKQALLKKHKKLEKRAANLKTLLNLFRGSGFVEYVSSIYLRQLCDHANERFQRLTRNQLSLMLNEDNDFEIIDYLNEGRSRSVKTLSGGQSFQVSLSLALALAENVQSNAAANKNFFFIDEGFGTQDAESINIIFETLLSLNKEDKIVGIISHVEELKDRIPTSLTIEKDEEKGSLVRVNQ